MTMRRCFGVCVGLACLVAPADGFVRQRDEGGRIVWRGSVAFAVVFNSRNPASQHQAWRRAMQTLSEVDGSILRVVEDGPTTHEDPVVGDGRNSLALMDSNAWEFYSPDDPFVVVSAILPTGEAVESDVFFNYADFVMRSDLNGSLVQKRHLDMESVALAALLMAAANLDHSPLFEHVMFAGLPDGAIKTDLTPSERSALRAIFSDGTPSAALGGRVSKAGQAVAYAYVCATPGAGATRLCGLTDASGAYVIPDLAPGLYRVQVRPFTSDPRRVVSPVYRQNLASNLNFLAERRAGWVAVGPGQTTGGVDFAVSATAASPDPHEAAEPRPIATDGTPMLFNTWPPGDVDRATFDSRAGRCYAVGTDHTGVATVAMPERLAASRTVLTVSDGTTVVAQSASRDEARNDPRSLTVFCESAQGRTLEVAVGQRESDAAGAGFFFELFVRELSPAAPRIEAVDPPVALVGSRSFVVVRGQGLLPGARLSIGGASASLEAAGDCGPGFDCAALTASLPAELGAGAHDVTVVNPDGQAHTLTGGLELLPRPAGPVFDVYWWGQWPFPATLADAKALCWGDYDRDGDADLFRASAAGFRLLRYDGDGVFADVTAASGLVAPGQPDPMFGCAWGDIDDDGDLDLYVTMEPIAEPDENRLYVNRLVETGLATFTEEGGPRGVAAGSGDLLTRPTFLDHDGDGDLDILVATLAAAVGVPRRPNRLLRNAGDGSFSEVGASAGIDTTAEQSTQDVVVGDFDGDGRHDMYWVRLPVAGGDDGADRLWLNDGAGGFVDATAASGIQATDHCNNAQAADFDNDGDLDLVCFLSSKPGAAPARLYVNAGDGRFADVAVAAGLTHPVLAPRWCSTMTLLDHDLDGDTDIYLGCRPQIAAPAPSDHLDLLLSNELIPGGSLTFRDVTVTSGLSAGGNYDFRTDVVTAVDHDGDLDADLFKSGRPSYDLIWGGLQNNPDFPRDPAARPTRDAIKIRLRGTVSNPHGIGARVTAIRDLGSNAEPDEPLCLASAAPAGEARTRWMLSRGGNQPPYEIVFAFGDPLAPDYEGTVECVIVDWPSGLRQAYAGLPLHATVTLVEGPPTLRVLDVTPATSAQAGDEPVTIRGFHFAPGARVRFGQAEATAVQVIDANTLTCRTPRWQPLGPADVTVTNPDGTSHTVQDAFTFEGSLQLEVVDPNPDLMVGAAVSSTPSILARSWARPVVGLAADGATRAVLRLEVPPAASPGSVRFRIVNRHGIPALAAWGLGVLFEPGTQPAGLTELTVPVRSLGDGRQMAFAVLHAPDDPRAIRFSHAPFFIAKTEPFFVEARYCELPDCASGQAQTVRRQLDLHRPPIVLLHGGYGSAETWNWSGNWLPFYALPGVESLPELHVFKGDYSAIHDRHLDEIVRYWDDAIVNGGVRGMRHAEGIAVTRAFVVAHSVAAAVTRLYVNDGGDLAYRRDDNFGRGDILGLVTLTGLHTGSVVAELLWRVLADAPRPVAAEARRLAARLGFPIDRGLIEDVAYSSAAMRNLPGSPRDLPVHVMWASGGTGLQAKLLWGLAPYRIRFPVGVLDHLGYDLNDLFLGGCQHDGLLFALTQQGHLNWPGPMDPDDLTELEFSTLPAPALWGFHWTVAKEWPASDALLKLLTGPIRGATPYEPEWCFWDPADNWFCEGFPDNAALPEDAFSGCDPGASSPAVLSPIAAESTQVSAGLIAIVAPAEGAPVAPGETLAVEVVAQTGFAPDRVSLFTSTGFHATDADGPPYLFDVPVPADAWGTLTISASAVTADLSLIGAAPDVNVVVDLGGVALLGLELAPETLVLAPSSTLTQVRVVGSYGDGQRRRLQLPVAGLELTTGDPSVATVAADGRVEARAVGETRVEARYLGRTAGSRVVVDDVPLTLGLDADEVRWSERAHAVGYDVIVGNLDVLRASGGDFSAAVTGCLADDLADTTVDHGAVAAPAFFLVRPVVSAESVGSFNADGAPAATVDRDPGIEASGSGCP